MALTRFVRNVQDLSDGRGFKFRFLCDSCGDRFDTDYIVSKTSLLGSLWSMAGGAAARHLSGGLVGSGLGYGLGSELGRGVQDKERAAAYEQAVAEARATFRHCPSCQGWVCARCRPAPGASCARCVRQQQMMQQTARMNAAAAGANAPAPAGPRGATRTRSR